MIKHEQPLTEIKLSRISDAGETVFIRSLLKAPLFER